ncbi:unnamed protein product [Ectocarpus sp. 12 AP-2014]
MDRFVLPSAHDAGPFPGKGLVLDLGCGSGRDTVYMAQRLPPGTRVVGVDNHSYALERGARLAERWLEDTACEWSLADLRKEGSLDGMRASIVHGHRFKCERLLPLLRDHVLLPGGYFIWSTFLDTGSENSVPPWRPSRMMR